MRAHESFGAASCRWLGGICSEGAWALGHGWSKAQPVDTVCSPTTLHPEGARAAAQLMPPPPPRGGVVEQRASTHGFRCAPPVAMRLRSSGAEYPYQALG